MDWQKLLELVWHAATSQEFWTAFLAAGGAAIGGLKSHKKNKSTESKAIKAADDCAQLRSDFERMKRLLDDVQEELARKSDELKELRADSKRKDGEIAQLRAQLQTALSEVEYLRSRERDQADTINKLSRENSELAERLKQLIAGADVERTLPDDDD